MEPPDRGKRKVQLWGFKRFKGKEWFLKMSQIGDDNYGIFCKYVLILLKSKIK
jgi:hypothetical protein